MQTPFEHIEVLLAKSFAGEANSEELKAIEQFKSAEADSYEAFQKSWTSANPENFFEKTDVEAAWAQVRPKTRSKQIYWVSGIAASLTLIAMITFFLINRMERSTYAMLRETSTQFGETRTIELPDGSSVRLNAGSTLRYYPKFDGNTREVFLDGEAYFDVARNNRKPFIVHIGEMDVRVHGTAFNVDAYSVTGAIKVAVQSGRVSFHKQGKETEGVHLQALQLGTYSYSDNSFTKSLVSESDFAWLDEKIIFDRTTLGDAIEELNRWYDLDISLVNNDLANCRISATFHHQTPEEVLNAITLMLNLETVKNGRKVTLKGDGCQLN